MSSRYPSLLPDILDSIQRQAYDLAVTQCELSFGDKFIWRDKNGCLLGPFGPLLYVPSIMKPFFIMLEEVGNLPDMPPSVRETTILAVGSVFKSPYELYAHGKFAMAVTELSEAQIAAIRSGQKPLDSKDKLNDACDVAFDVSVELAHGRGRLSQKNWERAIQVLGEAGTLALIQYISLYAYTCVWLNATAAEAPEDDTLESQVLI